MTTDEYCQQNEPQEHKQDGEADQVGVRWMTSEHLEASLGCDKRKNDQVGMVMKRPSFCSM